MARLHHALQHATVLALALILTLAGGALAAAGGTFILGLANSSGTAQTGLLAHTTFPLHALVVQQAGSGNGGYFVSQGGSGMLGITKSANRYAMSGTNDGSSASGGAIIGMGRNNVAVEARSDAKPPINIVGPLDKPPMTVNSIVKVNYLNADLLDGMSFTDLLPSKRYTVWASVAVPPDGSLVQVVASCDTGDLVLDGGFRDIGPDSRVVDNYPGKVTVANTGASPDTVGAVAVCLDYLPWHAATLSDEEPVRDE